MDPYITISNLFQYNETSKEIMKGEKTVDYSLKNGYLPEIVKCKEWNAIKTHYGLENETKIDNVQYKVCLPPGWKIERNESDVYGRCCIIYDQDKVQVGSTFLKNTIYDYYGYTSFNEVRLKELGILK